MMNDLLVSAYDLLLRLLYPKKKKKNLYTIAFARIVVDDVQISASYGIGLCLSDTRRFLESMQKEVEEKDEEETTVPMSRQNK